jgi:hypothetical protein
MISFITIIRIYPFKHSANIGITSVLLDLCHYFTLSHFFFLKYSHSTTSNVLILGVDTICNLPAEQQAHPQSRTQCSRPRSRPARARSAFESACSARSHESNGPVRSHPVRAEWASSTGTFDFADYQASVAIAPATLNSPSPPCRCERGARAY